MGNCGTKAKVQLTTEEKTIGKMLHGVHKGFDQKYTADLVADGIDTPELLQAASSKQLMKAGIPQADAKLISKALKAKAKAGSAADELPGDYDAASNEAKATPEQAANFPGADKAARKAAKKKKKEEAAAAAAGAPAEQGLPEGDDCWCQPVAGDATKLWVSQDFRELVLGYFYRYNIKLSSTPTEEFRQLCTSLVVHLDLDVDVAAIDTLVSNASHKDIKTWDVDKFIQWFTSPQTFGAPISWCTGDESDEEDSDEEDECWLRAGSYAGVMTSTDGRSRPVFLKLRMDEDEETKLYERFYNDEYLGWSSKNEPLGLFKFTGSVDNEAKSISLIKSYVAGETRTKALNTGYTGDLSSVVSYDLFKFEGSAGADTNTIKGTYDLANSQICSGKYDIQLNAILTKLQIGKSGEFHMAKVEKKTG
jgi:hypothetical protein